MQPVLLIGLAVTPRYPATERRPRTLNARLRILANLFFRIRDSRSGSISGIRDRKSGSEVIMQLNTDVSRRSVSCRRYAPCPDFFHSFSSNAQFCSLSRGTILCNSSVCSSRVFAIARAACSSRTLFGVVGFQRNCIFSSERCRCRFIPAVPDSRIHQYPLASNSSNLPRRFPSGSQRLSMTDWWKVRGMAIHNPGIAP